MSADASELFALAADWENVERRSAPAVVDTTKRAAQNIMTQLRREATGSRRLKWFPTSISYDVWNRVGGPEAEIGPDKQRRQGPLGNILYFGTSTSGPVLPDPAQALDREIPTYLDYLGKAISDAL